VCQNLNLFVCSFCFLCPSPLFFLGLPVRLRRPLGGLLWVFVGRRRGVGGCVRLCGVFSCCWGLLWLLLLRLLWSLLRLLPFLRLFRLRSPCLLGRCLRRRLCLCSRRLLWWSGSRGVRVRLVLRLVRLFCPCLGVVRWCAVSLGFRATPRVLPLLLPSVRLCLLALRSGCSVLPVLLVVSLAASSAASPAALVRVPVGVPPPCRGSVPWRLLPFGVGGVPFL